MRHSHFIFFLVSIVLCLTVSMTVSEKLGLELEARGRRLGLEGYSCLLTLIHKYAIGSKSR